MKSYTEFTDRLGDFFQRFFHGYDPHGHFREHVEKNAISRTIIGGVTTLIWLFTIAVRIGAEIIAPGVLNNFFATDVFLLQYYALSAPALFQLPIQLFAVCSLFSIWATYNNYILIIHHNCVNWSVRIVASFAVAIMIAVFVLGFVFPYSKITILLLAVGYLAALEVSFSLRNSLKHRSKLYNGGETPELAMRNTSQWLLVNTIVAITLGLMSFFLPSTKDIIDLSPFNKLPREALNAMIIWQYLVYMLAFLVVVVSAIRSGVYLDYGKYAEEIQEFNGRIPTFGPPNANQSGVPQITSQVAASPVTPGNGVTTFSGILATTRLLGGALPAALLLGLHAQSSLYAMCCLFFLAFSFSFNDLADFYSGRDLVAHPSRPLPAGKLSSNVAAVICVFLAVAGLLLSLYSNQLGAFFVLYVLSILYSVGLKRFVPVIATPLWCAALTWLALFPFHFVGLNYVLVFLLLYGRELLLDLRDVEADDRFCWWPSLPSVLGDRTHTLVLGLLATAGLIGLLSDNKVVWLGGSIGILIYFGVLILAREKKSATRWSAEVLRVLMIALLAI